MEGSEGMTNIRWRVIVREVLRYYWCKGQQIKVNKRKLGGKERRRNEKKKKSPAKDTRIILMLFLFLLLLSW